MAVRKTKKGAALKRWFKEKWKDEKGNACGSSKNKGVKKCRPSKKVSKKTPRTWGSMSKSQKAKAVAEKKRVGMGKRTSAIKKKKKEMKLLSKVKDAMDFCATGKLKSIGDKKKKQSKKK